MSANDHEPGLEERISYSFSQVSGAIVGGILLCIVISATGELLFGTEMTIGGAAFITLFCIPVAWGIRAIWVRYRDSRNLRA